MGFDIHVAGLGGFLYTRNNVPYGDEWNLNWMERILLSLARVRDPYSLTRKAAVKTLSAATRVVMVETFYNTITLLIANHGDGDLNVAIRRRHLLWPDTGGFCKIRLSANEDAFSVVRSLARFLNEHGMNKFGPVAEITGALTEYDLTYKGGSGYIVNVSLFD
ncbi:MAG: hypothetical protein N2Z23_07450 [Pyrinomonadaceae bacterium]|nr:hypothetical protein [Pyrinomonadaceae bacterium]MCX7640259.1 hypothetical protein [Pyrinomonadaceae bacterium]MDW8305418.1 hypothetical protein [Acidobacteriota bacterium]